MNHSGDEWVDPRYIGHILEGLDDFVNSYYVTLRLTPTKTNPDVPKVVRVI